MASVLISSKSGQPILPPGTGARIRVLWKDQNRIDLKGDITDAEAEELIKAFGLEEVDIRPDRRLHKPKRPRRRKS